MCKIARAIGNKVGGINIYTCMCVFVPVCLSVTLSFIYIDRKSSPTHPLVRDICAGPSAMNPTPSYSLPPMDWHKLKFVTFQTITVAILDGAF